MLVATYHSPDDVCRVRFRELITVTWVRMTVMTKAAVVILAGTESHADHGRLANGLEAAKEFAETDGDELEVIFDGAGTQWIPELEDQDSDYHELYQVVKADSSACDYCSDAFGVTDAVADSGIQLVGDHDGHPSIRSLVDDDYEIITF